MASIPVQIQDKEVLHLFSLMKKRGLDLRTPYRQISYIAHEDVIKRFENESDEKGQRWRPIMLTKQTMSRRKMLTKKGKVRKGREIFKILQDTGRLKGSIKPYSNAYGAEVKTSVEYAAAHNYGYSPRNLPARPFMRDLSENSKSRIAKLLQIHLFNARD